MSRPPKNDDPPIEDLIGRRIRELRLTRKWTISRLAEGADISVGQLSKIETGKAAVSIKSLIRLSQVLDRPLSYFFKREDEIPKVLGTMSTVAGPESQGIRWFADEVRRRTNKKIALIPLKASQLGNGLDQVEQLADGFIDIFIEELYHYQRYTPGFDIFSLPYLFSSSAGLQAFLEADYFRERLLEPLSAHNIRLLNPRWNWIRGVERVIISHRPIVSPEDLEGRRIRIFDCDLLGRFFEKLGAVPVVVPWTEVMAALENGLVDAVATHKAHLFPLGFCRRARYVTRLGDVPPVLGLGINQAKFQALPPDLQAALRRAADAGGDRFSEVVIAAEKENEPKNIRTHGAVYLTVDLEPWTRAAGGVIAELAAEGRIDRTALDEILGQGGGRSGSAKDRGGAVTATGPTFLGGSQ